MLRAARTILRKDLLLELRTKEAVPAMTLFTLTVYVLFHFGLDRNSLDGELASGVLWVTLLLAAVIGVTRLFAVEREQGGIDGLLLAPVDRTALFVAKAAALFAFLTAVELVAVPAFAQQLLQAGLSSSLIHQRHRALIAHTLQQLDEVIQCLEIKRMCSCLQPCQLQLGRGRRLLSV